LISILKFKADFIHIRIFISKQRTINKNLIVSFLTFSSIWNKKNELKGDCFYSFFELKHKRTHQFRCLSKGSFRNVFYLLFQGCTPCKTLKSRTCFPVGQFNQSKYKLATYSQIDFLCFCCYFLTERACRVDYFSSFRTQKRQCFFEDPFLEINEIPQSLSIKFIF